MPKIILYVDEEEFQEAENQEIGCYILNTQLSREFVQNFSSRAWRQSKLILAYGENALSVCNQYKLDGVVIDLSRSPHAGKEAKALRQQTNNKILGIISSSTRHDAMLISEAEPDFVIFSFLEEAEHPSKELVNWYNELFLIQSAVWVKDEKTNLEGIKTDNIIIPASQKQKFSQFFCEK